MNDSPELDWNEERLRLLVLGPLLAALNIAPSEIAVEPRFKIRLGRTEHAIGHEWAAGRADAIVRDTEGRNLFVVELKCPGETLEDADRDQGISYARLLDRIAPFVVLSNGKQTRIFDAVSKTELGQDTFATESAFFKNGCRLSLEEDVAARFEALAHFVGYSQANVQSFSLAQVERAMRPLLGTSQTRGKYVPGIYVQRDSVRAAVRTFLADDAPVFALVGESGCGKTNEMCALAQEMAQTHVTLFFPAFSIVRTPDETLADEFNWAFSQTLATPQIARNLAKIAERLGRPVLLFIDALDESEAPNVAAAVSEFAKHLAGASKHIRLIVSAKSNEWKRFASMRGTPSHLELGLSSTSPVERDPKAAWHSGEPMALGGFSESELDAAFDRYAQMFGVHPSGYELRALCRDPFFLRTFCEVYEGLGDHPPITTRDALIARWLARKLDVVKEPEAARTRLRLLAQRVYERTRSQNDERVTRLSLESVPESELDGKDFSELVAHGIVLQSTDEYDRRVLRFYYSQVLYFIVARWVLRLDQLSVAEFRALLPSLLEHALLQGVLAWHMREAPPGQLVALESELHGRALVFVSTYSMFFETWMPALRSRVAPFTDGAIGVAYIADDASYVDFCLYAQNAANGKTVSVVSVPAGSDHNDRFDALYRLSGIGVQGGGTNFANSDPRCAALALAWESVKKVILAGGLDERATPELSIETVLAIAGHYETRKRLRLPPASYRLPNREGLLPLDLDGLRIMAQEYLGVQQKENEWVHEQVRTRSRFTDLDVNGGGSIDMSGFDREAARAAVSEAVVEGADFSQGRQGSNHDLAHMVQRIDELRRRFITRIEQDLLPAADRLPLFYNARMIDAYSEPALTELIDAFFRRGFEAYLKLVSANFGALADKLNTYARQPIRVEVAYQYQRAKHAGGQVGMQWGIGSDPKIERTCVHVDSDPHDHFFKRDDERRWTAPDGFKVDFISGQSLDGLLFPYRQVGYGVGANDRPATARDAPIRQFAYARIESDFNSIQFENLLEWVLGCEIKN